MMKKNYFITLLPFILLLFSCSVDAMQNHLNIEGEHGYDFKESRATWKDLKKEKGDSYTYTVLEQSWTGAGSETTIEVKKGKVIARNFVAFEISDEDGTKQITDSYNETSKKDIGSHSTGAPPHTIDDLYRICISRYLTTNQETDEVLFETNEEGVLMLCGIVLEGCQDDCYRGIRISNFSWK